MTPLVLNPAFPFPSLAAALAALGFTRDDAVRPLTADTLPGEPELAAWTLGDARLTYTFNPAVLLRVLAPAAALPDELRAAVAARLPHLDAAAVAFLLAEPDPARAVLGLFAARVLALRDLLPQISALRVNTSRLVSRAAAVTHAALQQGAAPDAYAAPQRGPAAQPQTGEAAARREALRLLAVLCEQATPVLAALTGPDAAAVAESLRPHPDDYPRVFLPSVAALARAAYEALWRTPPEVERPGAGPLTLRVDAAPAGMLGADNELSRRFPGGYRALAPHLRTDRIWFVWRYVARDEPGRMRYDGLVRIDDRWAWFPKPHRVIGEILRAAIH